MRRVWRSDERLRLRRDAEDHLSAGKMPLRPFTQSERSSVY
jgi:hypothetical protein